MLTGRLVGLRPSIRADVEALHDLRSDPVHVALVDARPYAPVSLAARLAEFDKRQADPDPATAFFTVRRLDDPDGAAIGSVGLWGIDLHNGGAHIGISLLPDARGRGLGRDCLELICRFGYVVRGLHRLSLETLDLNAAMRATATACGFVEEGRLRGAAWYLGRRVDEILYGQLADEWRTRHPDAGPAG